MLENITPSAYFDNLRYYRLMGGIDPVPQLLAQIGSYVMNRDRRKDTPPIKPGDLYSPMAPRVPTRMVLSDAEMDSVGAAAERIIGVDCG